MSRLGGGEVGGKAAGLLAVHDVLPPATGAAVTAIPGFVVIATDVFDRFVEANGLDALALDSASDEAIARAFQSADLPAELAGDLRALAGETRTPLAVRSSSLLEDAAGRPFAGVYATKMTPNNELAPDARFRRLVEAVKFVWASTWFRQAREYRRALGLGARDEKMAVVLQEVVGQRRNDRFYPEISGVARSYDFYPGAGGRPDDGVVHLALGLGKTIVDGGTSWRYSPAQPARSAPFGSLQDLMAGTQAAYWAINMGRVPVYDPVDEIEFLIRGDLADAEADEALRYVASTFDPARDRLVPGTGARGPRVLDFAPLLVLREFPLNDTVRAALAAGERAAGAKVEMEFAATIRHGAEGARLEFDVLQVRALTVSDEPVALDGLATEGPDVVVRSAHVLGNGARDDIADVVYVRPERFDVLQTRAIASDLATLNAALVEEGRPYVLVGFGRWGSTHPSLGIPVYWSQISGARVIVEATLPGMDVEPSQGSHFFHNLTAFSVSYFMVRHDAPGAVNWDALAQLPAVRETATARHVRFPVPLAVRVDGRTGRGVILSR